MASAIPTRRQSNATFPYVKLIEGDLTDATLVVRAIEVVNPAEINNLAAVRYVGYSFNNRRSPRP